MAYARLGVGSPNSPLACRTSPPLLWSRLRSRFQARIRVCLNRNQSPCQDVNPLQSCGWRRSLSLYIIRGRIGLGRSAKLRCNGSIPLGASTAHSACGLSGSSGFSGLSGLFGSFRITIQTRQTKRAQLFPPFPVPSVFS